MFIGVLSQGDAGTSVPHYWGREIYREIEGLGFDGLFCGERFATYHAPAFDCASLVTAMACATDHIAIGTSAVVTSVRHPSLLAKEFACIDQIAGGRLILGVGIGGDLPSEFHAMGASLQGRGARASESIEIIRRYFRGERFSYHGKYFDLDDVWIDPPAAQPNVPIWYAGRVDAARRRAALQCDGFLTYFSSPAICRHMFSSVREHAERARRELPPGYVWGTIVNLSLGDDRQTALRRGKEYLARNYDNPDLLGEEGDQYVVAGSAADCLEGLLGYAEAGCTHLIFQFVPDPNIRLIDQIRQVAADLLPVLP